MNLFIDAGVTDPLFGSVIALPNFNGADGTSAFTDAIPGVTWTAAGNAQKNSNQLLLDGSGDYLIATLANAIGTGNFCIEAIIQPAVSATQMEIFSISNGSSTAAVDLVFEVAASGNLRFSVQNGSGSANVDVVTSGASITAGNIYHVAGNVNGTSAKAYIAGVERGSGTITGTRVNGHSSIQIGRLVTGANRYFNGRVHALRLTQASRYTTTPFTPPTAPFPTS